MESSELQQLVHLATDVKRQQRASKNDLATAKALAAAVIALVEEVRELRRKIPRSDETPRMAPSRRR